MKELIIKGEYEEGALQQAKNCLKDAEHFLLMADNHKGYGMPIGGVAVYKDKISPAGVGFDIACGNKAVKLDIKYEDIKDSLSDLADSIFSILSFGVGLSNDEKVEHPLFDDTAWNINFHRNNPEIKNIAQKQLGTIGSGNHYVDIFKDEEDFVWIGVHFGSRGLGHKTASHFMQLAGNNLNIMDEKPHLLDINTVEGQEYITAMNLAGRYAYAGRDWVCLRVVKILQGNITKEVHNHHNFAWLENHNGVDYWVVRKGATPAFPGQEGFVGGSMGDNAVIVKGIDGEESKSLFYSTVHGAGRVMSRTQAAGKFKGWGDKRKRVSEGLVNFDEVKSMLIEKGIHLRGGGADEAPQVYKRLNEVLDYHKDTIKILHTLTPLVVCMAGNEFDPYKD